MFDIGWSELVVIAVVALIAIGPKELPGVLRMIGQWMGKARKIAMREAEMADLKKSFDEVKEAATGFTSGNLMTSLEKDVSSALRIDDVEKPAASNAETAAIEAPNAANADPTMTSMPDVPTTPAVPIPETFTEADAHAAASEPLTIVQEVASQHSAHPAPAEPRPAPDAKAS